MCVKSLQLQSVYMESDFLNCTSHSEINIYNWFSILTINEKRNIWTFFMFVESNSLSTEKKTLIQEALQSFHFFLVVSCFGGGRLKLFFDVIKIE